MVDKWGITYLLMGYIGVITHLLTIDPNFLGHPSNPSGDWNPGGFGIEQSPGGWVSCKGPAPMNTPSTSRR